MTSVTLLPEARRQFVGGLLRTRGHASILETLFEMWCQHFQQRRDGRVLKTSVGPNGMRLAIPAAKKFICFERLIIRDEVGGPVRFLRQHVLGDGTWHRFGQKHGMWADACAEAQAEENFHGQFMRSSGARKLIEKLWSMPLEETGIFSGAVQ
jgi:hypothetical protein